MQCAPIRAPVCTTAPAMMTLPSPTDAVGDTQAVACTTTAHPSTTGVSRRTASSRRSLASSAPKPRMAYAPRWRSSTSSPPSRGTPRRRVVSSHRSASTNPSSSHAAGAVRMASINTRACSPPPMTTMRRLIPRPGIACGVDAGSPTRRARRRSGTRPSRRERRTRRPWTPPGRDSPAQRRGDRAFGRGDVGHRTEAQPTPLAVADVHGRDAERRRLDDSAGGVAQYGVGHPHERPVTTVTQRRRSAPPTRAPRPSAASSLRSGLLPRRRSAP